MKKKKNITSFGNIVVFPGTVENLVNQAQSHVLQSQFHLANECFEKALQFTEGDEFILTAYAYSLYEVKSFEKAKVICEEILKLGPMMYLEVMELYLTISMQLKEFNQVERIIDSLIDEGAIPNEQMDKFNRLKELNATIAEKAEFTEEVQFLEEQMDPNTFELKSFLSHTPAEQMNQIHSLSMVNIRPLTPHLKNIIESELTHLFIKSLVLILFVEQQIDEELLISKFGKTEVVNPTNLKLPTNTTQFEEIVSIITNRFEQEPSSLEMVVNLIAKHAIVTYPFEWLDFDTQDVAQTYIDFVQIMFGSVQETNEELYEFLQKLEKLTEL